MKIAIIINDITMPGGLSRVAMNFLESQALFHDVELTVVSVASKFEQIQNESIEYLGLSPLHGVSSIRKVMWYIECLRAVQRYVNDNKFDVVISFGTAMTLLMSFCHFHRAKLWGAEHSAYSFGSKLRRFAKRFCYPKLDKLVCLTHFDKETYYDKYLENVVVIPNFNILSNSLPTIERTNKNIIFVGRYNKVKGVDYLLDIIENYSQRNSSWQFSLFGEGELESWLKEEVCKRQLERVVRVNSPTRNIGIEYERASILVLTSRSEGFPMVLLEAQAYGLPIVAFDCETGPNEIISNGIDGYLINDFDVEEFVDKLILISTNEKIRGELSTNALKNSKRFEQNSIIKLWEQEFKKNKF